MSEAALGATGASGSASLASSLADYTSVGANLFGGFEALAGNIFGAKKSKKAAKRAFRRELWMYQNRYQMMVEDLKKAGINPLMAVGMGAGGTPSAPMEVVPDFGEGGVSEGIARGAEKYYEMKQRAATLNILESEKEKAYHEAGRAGEEWSRVQQENILLKKEIDNWDAWRRAELESISASAAQMRANANHSNWGSKFLEQQYPGAVIEGAIDRHWLGRYVKGLKYVMGGSGAMLPFLGGALAGGLGRGAISRGVGGASPRYPMSGGMRSR